MMMTVSVRDQLIFEDNVMNYGMDNVLVNRLC